MKTLLELAEDAFGESGAVTQIGLAHRPEQLHYAQSIAKWLDGKKPYALIEGDTGIGKSMAGLVMLMLYHHKYKKRVIFSTFTLALQRQIIGGDITLAEDILGKLGFEPLKFARRVGANQFVCPERVALKEKQIFGDEEPSIVWKQFTEWVHHTQINGSGRLEEWYEEYSNELPHDLSDSDVCLTRISKANNQAWAKSLDDIDGADLVITSHALLVADAACGGKILSTNSDDYGAIFCDEGDRCSDAAENYFRRRVQLRRIASTVSKMEKRPSLQKNLCGELFRIEDELSELKGKGNSNAILCRSAGSGEVDNLLTRNLPIIEKLLTKASRVKDLNDDIGLELTDYRDYVSSFLNDISCNKPRQVRSVGFSSKLIIPSLMSSRNLPGNIFKFFAKQHIKVGFTSATLSDGNHKHVSFKDMHLNHSIGLNDIEIESRHHPHHFGKVQFKLMSPDCPGVFTDEGDYSDGWLSRTTQKIIDASGEGNVLVLCGSYQEVDVFKSRLSAKHHSENFNFERCSFHEKGTSLKSLVDNFINEGGILISPCLWEGHSIRNLDGSQLFNQLLITRVPFRPPSEIEEDLFVNQYLQDVASATLAKAQNHYRIRTISSALKKLRQGIGRLIRSEADVGTIWLCDPRFPQIDEQYDFDGSVDSHVKPLSVLTRAIPERFLSDYHNACVARCPNIKKRRTSLLYELWS